MAKTYDVLLKILIVGDSKSRKTDLLRKYSCPNGEDFPTEVVGLDYHLQDIFYKGKKLKLQLWDTAGQERFRSVTSSYYRGAQGCLLVFSMNSMLTFTGISYWLDEIKSNAPDMFQTVLVALSDGVSEPEVDMDIARQFATEHSLRLISVDINDAQQVQNVFESVVDQVMIQCWNKKVTKEESVRIDSGRSLDGNNSACFC